MIPELRSPNKRQFLLSTLMKTLRLLCGSIHHHVKLFELQMSRQLKELLHPFMTAERSGNKADGQEWSFMKAEKGRGGFALDIYYQNNLETAVSGP